jgi:hypothetical protein
MLERSSMLRIIYTMLRVLNGGTCWITSHVLGRVLSPVASTVGSRQGEGGRNLVWT